MIPRDLVPMLVAALMAADAKDAPVEHPGHDRQGVSRPVSTTEKASVVESPVRTPISTTRLSADITASTSESMYSVSLRTLQSDARCRPSQVSVVDYHQSQEALATPTSHQSSAAARPHARIPRTAAATLISAELTRHLLLVSASMESFRKQMLRVYVRERYLRGMTTRHDSDGAAK